MGESAYDSWKTTEEIGEDGDFECICGKRVEEEDSLCKDCMLEAVEDEKADRIRKGEY